MSPSLQWRYDMGCTKWSPGRIVMYSNRLCRPTSGCRYSWFIFEGCWTFKWDIKWQRILKHYWLCGITRTITSRVMALLFSSLFFLRVWLHRDILKSSCNLSFPHFLCKGIWIMLMPCCFWAFSQLPSFESRGMLSNCQLSTSCQVTCGWNGGHHHV